MAARSPAKPAKAHKFGGDWTSAKLHVLASYLSAYTKVMKNQRFVTAYIDAFAGSGYRGRRSADPGGSLQFPDMAASASQQLLDGSARIALKTSPRFDRYIFIEQNAGRCAALEDLRTEFPDKSADIRIKQGEANAEIQALCARDWRAGKHKAVLFLDPYGLQVEWATVEAVAKTGSIDLWLLFPLGIGVSRLATRSGDIPESWRNRLNLLLGTEAWYDAFYRVESLPTLFGSEEDRVVKASHDVMGRYFIDRLRTAFPVVADDPLVLRNSSNCPLYLFCFAAGNGGRGGETALRIAKHLLTRG